MVSWSNTHLDSIIFALKDQRHVESCCRRWLMASALGMRLREEALEAICLMTRRLEGVHTPRDSTTRGKNNPPLPLPLAGRDRCLFQPHLPPLLHLPDGLFG